MKTRVISGLAMVPLILFLYLGGYPLILLTVLVSILGLYEFNRGLREIDIVPSSFIGYASIVVLYITNIYQYYMGDIDYIFVLGWITIVVMASSCYMFDVKNRSLSDGMATLVGIIYIVFFAFHIVMIDQTESFSVMKWLVPLTAFGSDIFAYFAGSMIGKHKLCEDLSPKKTFEGAIGGVIGSVVLSAAFGYLFAKDLFVHFIIIGLIASPITMLGDLTASAYKRSMGVKDFGKLIPGHGGIMDRFDSILFAAPFVFYYIQIVMVYFLGM